MDHYFGLCEKMRLRVPDTTKYFCVSEAIAHYLQKILSLTEKKDFHWRAKFCKLDSINEKISRK